jgi:hypothetical protein
VCGEATAIASHVPLAYLASITVFALKGLLQVDWGPKLLTEVEAREFEVRR